MQSSAVHSAVAVMYIEGQDVLQDSFREDPRSELTEQ